MVVKITSLTRLPLLLPHRVCSGTTALGLARPILLVSYPSGCWRYSAKRLQSDLVGSTESLSATACSGNETACVQHWCHWCKFRLLYHWPSDMYPIDLCHSYVDPIRGCVNSNISCPVGNNCTSFSCNVTSGSCKMTVSVTQLFLGRPLSNSGKTLKTFAQKKSVSNFT